MLQYEQALFISRDTSPTQPELSRRLSEVREHLLAAQTALIGEPEAHAIAAVGFLGAELEHSDQASPAFGRQLQTLIEATDRLLQDISAAAPARVNGQRHERRTRTDTRDNFLIPALTELVTDLRRKRGWSLFGRAPGYRL
ncbi:MAG: hypothetical protein U5P41_07060 [Gammaproteobacteria bacterium]|nr:hypothetical protein [Gammaproteobacteria bacterium]